MGLCFLSDSRRDQAFSDVQRGELLHLALADSAAA